VASEDIEDHVGGVDALAQSRAAGVLNRRQSIAQHRGKNLDHLPVAISSAGEFAADAIEPSR
jgi:hypothetical protein